MRLQHFKRYFASIVFAATCIVEENAAWFLAECNDKFSGRFSAMRSRDDDGVGMCVADVRDGVK